MSVETRDLHELRLNGRQVGLRVRYAKGFWSRLIGFWPSPRCHSVDAIVFPRCVSVHTFGMTRRVDVVFVDECGRILRTANRVAPWRVLRDSRASLVVELRPGLASALGVVPGEILEMDSRSCDRSRHRQTGSAILEFFLAATLVLLPLISGILEFAQLATARQILAMATSEAARSFAVASMDERSAHLYSGFQLPPGEASIRLSLARGLLPLFGGSFEAGKDASQGLERWRTTLTEVGRPDRLMLLISEGIVETSDVEIGRLEVRYCRELFFAPASYVLPQLMKQWDQDPFSRNCHNGGRIPLAASAPVSVSRYP